MVWVWVLSRERDSANLRRCVEQIDSTLPQIPFNCDFSY
ncbi:hypothetical protein CKA32_004344 [Geitlerinema sp. FC II]|nr:hypothetical protein CKA32_004344 [Geitlerinema sp. FC II]